MNEEPEISVVMANHNGRSYLGAAIKSLRAQTFEDWELIFVDDASQDSSARLASIFARDDARIRIVRQPAKRGPAAARNVALQMARGRWIAVFDSDDIMLPRRLQTLRERAAADKAEVVADNLLVFSDDRPVPRPFLPKGMTALPRWIGLAEFVNSNRLYSRVPNLGYLKPFINTNLLRTLKLRYDERLLIGEDYELMARLLASGVRLRIEPSAQYMYRKHPNSISYRLSTEAITALLAADMRLTDSFAPLSRDVADAFMRRRRSLESMLAYDQVVHMVKMGQYRNATATGLLTPRLWPLLTRPVRARLGRLQHFLRARPGREQMIPQPD